MLINTNIIGERRRGGNENRNCLGLLRGNGDWSALLAMSFRAQKRTKMPQESPVRLLVNLHALSLKGVVESPLTGTEPQPPHVHIREVEGVVQLLQGYALHGEAHLLRLGASL